MFGSNGQDKADYSRGVLERFTRRAPRDWVPPDGEKNSVIKTVANPRKINFFSNAHYPIYFEGGYSVNENGKIIHGWYNEPVLADTIVINHYHTKSREEYEQKIQRGRSDLLQKRENAFSHSDRNEEFDDGILRYRAERAKDFRPSDKSQADARLLNALVTNLSPTLIPNTPPQFYAGKMETFLTCRAVASYLQTRLTDDSPAKFF